MRIRQLAVSDAIKQALSRDRIVDITTIGRRTGMPRRIEIWMFQVGDRLYVTGSPGRRDWYANLLAEPRLTLHLKRSVQANLPARAQPVTDPAARRKVFVAIASNFRAGVDELVAASPLVAIEIDSG